MVERGLEWVLSVVRRRCRRRGGGREKRVDFVVRRVRRGRVDCMFARMGNGVWGVEDWVLNAKS